MKQQAEFGATDVQKCNKGFDLKKKKSEKHQCYYLKYLLSANMKWMIL